MFCFCRWCINVIYFKFTLWYLGDLIYAMWHIVIGFSLQLITMSISSHIYFIPSFFSVRCLYFLHHHFAKVTLLHVWLLSVWFFEVVTFVIQIQPLNLTWNLLLHGDLYHFCLLLSRNLTKRLKIINYYLVYTVEFHCFSSFLEKLSFLIEIKCIYFQKQY